jgi:hypothetical protein
MGVIEEQNMYQPLTSDLAWMEKQCQDTDVCFLGLKSEFEPAREQNLCSFDMSTKSLCHSQLEFICSKLGLYDIYASI